MATIDQLYADMLPSLPGVPLPLLRSQFARAAQSFCARTKCWAIWTDEVATTAAGTDYDFELPPQAQVALIERATCDGNDLPVESWRAFDHGDERDGSASVHSRDLLTFQLGRPLGAGKKIRIRLVLVPTANASAYPDHLIQQYGDSIAAGAKALLMAVPGASFGNLQLAPIHAAAFEQSIASAAVREWRGRTLRTPRAAVQWL